MSVNVESLLKRVNNGEFQDDEDPSKAALQLGRAMVQSWTQPEDSQVLLAHQALLRAFAFPEHRKTALSDGSPDLVGTAVARAQVANNEAELDGLLGCTIRELALNSSNRGQTLALLSAGLRVPHASVALTRLCLQSLSVALDLSPMTSSTSKSAAMLLAQLVMPLHSIQGRLSPTQSLLGAYHRELTLCIIKACSIAGSSETFESVLCELAGARYPGTTEGNSPKEVLFLHEIDSLLSTCEVPLTGKARAAVASRLLHCVGSLHAAVCERALQFWKSDVVLKKLQGQDQILSKTCDRALAKTSLEHWSQTVKTMAGAALLQASLGSGSQVRSDPTLAQAIRQAEEQAVAALNPKPAEVLPLPKSFSSTSVIRDATEPFAYGAFGALWKARAIVPGASRGQWPQIALKELEDPTAARAEAAIMQRIGEHPNLVAFLGLFELRQGTAISLVLEFVDGMGDLHTCVVERGPLSLEACKFMCGEVGAGLKYIHSRGVVFGDVKPENILLTRDGHAKLCDFGSAFVASGDMGSRVVGTVEYMPPEQVSSLQGDWWGFGCVVHYALTGRPPIFFDSESETDLATAFSRAVTFADQQGGSLLQDTGARQLVASLCSRSAGARPKDGGESMAFFEGFCPWRDLHRRTSTPALPVQRSGGTGQGQKGPWQRRTFSTIHSPMPQAYTIDGGFSVLCSGDCPRPITNFALPSDWISTSSPMLKVLECYVGRIPKQRIPVPLDHPALRQGASGAAKKMRTTRASTYNVAGIDLTAG